LTAYAYESGMTDSPVTAGGYTVQTGGSYPAFLTSYVYDLMNHLTLVSMTRGSTTQTRTFNYTKVGNIVGAELLSATNPENGTVNYTYDSFLRIDNGPPAPQPTDSVSSLIREPLDLPPSPISLAR
jgi:hypothetical protein